MADDMRALTSERDLCSSAVREHMVKGHLCHVIMILSDTTTVGSVNNRKHTHTCTTLSMPASSHHGSQRCRNKHGPQVTRSWPRLHKPVRASFQPGRRHARKGHARAHIDHQTSRRPSSPFILRALLTLPPSGHQSDEESRPPQPQTPQI